MPAVHVTYCTRRRVVRAAAAAAAVVSFCGGTRINDVRTAAPPTAAPLFAATSPARPTIPTSPPVRPPRHPRSGLVRRAGRARGDGDGVWARQSTVAGGGRTMSTNVYFDRTRRTHSISWDGMTWDGGIWDVGIWRSKNPKYSSICCANTRRVS